MKRRLKEKLKGKNNSSSDNFMGNRLLSRKTAPLVIPRGAIAETRNPGVIRRKLRVKASVL